MKINLVRTDAENFDFQQLILQLDRHLTERDKEAHSNCTPYNQVDKIHHVIVAYLNGNAVGCAALKEFEPKVIELKRMFVCQSARNKGIASSILQELEKWAIELGHTQCILETGVMLPEAIALYEKYGYLKTPNYAQYALMDKSVCYQKFLIKKEETIKE